MPLAARAKTDSGRGPSHLPTGRHPATGSRVRALTAWLVAIDEVAVRTEGSIIGFSHEGIHPHLFTMAPVVARLDGR